MVLPQARGQRPVSRARKVGGVGVRGSLRQRVALETALEDGWQAPCGQRDFIGGFVWVHFGGCGVKKLTWPWRWRGPYRAQVEP